MATIRMKEEIEINRHAENIVETLRKANESVKGTNNWNKYTMPQETKIDKKWVFVGWGTPVKQLPVKIKRVKRKIYLVQESELETDRYTVTDEVKQLLNF